MDKPDPQTNPSQSGDEVLTELRELGRNLRQMLETAWQSDERKKLQQELESGLQELTSNLSQTAQEFSASPTGQTLKHDLYDLNERIRSGEVEAKLRSEFLTALRAANSSLKQTTKPAPPEPPVEE
jgi:hypothetical protein